MATETERIADLLTESDDLSAAALLVAISEDDGLVVPREDLYLVRELEAAGCLSEGKRTPMGQRVAIVLRARGIRPLGSDA